MSKKLRWYIAPWSWHLVPWAWCVCLYLLIDDWIAYKRGHAHHFPWGE